jgi:hypothetical protein
VEKEAENHSSKEKNRNGDLCKKKKIAFLLEWGKISLDKGLLMGDPRGRPVLVIACDGSGSLNDDQMKMLKLLTTGYLESTAKRNIQVLAGLYHSGHIRKGVSGPLVQWIHHPQKTPATSGRDSVRALVSLPDTGRVCRVMPYPLPLSWMRQDAWPEAI